MRKIDTIIKIFFCYSALCISSFVQIPLLRFDFLDSSLVAYDYSPQFILCFLLAITFDKNYISLAAILYLVSGLIGLPIFAYGGGWKYIYEPSFPYILALSVLSMLTFIYKHERVWILKNASLIAIPAAHIFSLLGLILTGKLNLANFFSLCFYQLIYDLIFGFIIYWFISKEAKFFQTNSIVSQS